MRMIIVLALGLSCVYMAYGQVGSSISADGTAPNDNAMLDVQSPPSGDGKGLLIPRVTGDQRTNANASLAGGLLDNSGNLRGGAAQGLMVYQTDGSQGLYFNTSQTAAPAWVYLGNSITNYLPLTGGTMSGALNMGAQIVTNAAHVDFNADTVSVGRGANGITEGTALGFEANGFTQGSAVGKSANGSSYGTALGFGSQGTNFGVALGRLANGSDYGQAVGFQANGSDYGAAIGRQANGYNYGAAVGFNANGSTEGVALGDVANGYNYGAAVGQLSKGTNYGVAVGASANGSKNGAVLGYQANGYDSGAAMGREANGYDKGAAVGQEANGKYYGAAIGRLANGSDYGAAVGNGANGYNNGAALGPSANGYWNSVAVGPSANGQSRGVAVGYAAVGYAFGTAVGYLAAGTNYCVAIGAQANAGDGTERIAIGYNVTNQLDNTAAIRGHVYLDGGTGLFYRATFGTGSWTAKAFEIDHPLDPENKILRHFCLEGPQVWNVYAGNVQLVNGQAKVQLPDYYSALNLAGSEIYSLTPISPDRHATAVIEQEVINNYFMIGGSSDMKVSWTIKVLRNDPGCLEDLRRRPVEQMKSELETGN